LGARNLVIAIDGPAASGKSTTAKLVAARLGYIHVDTGAMYRAFALKVLRRGVKPDDIAGIRALVRETHIELRSTGTAVRVLLDGNDVTEEIREPSVSNAASAVSGLPEVREAMVREQRQMRKGGGIVLEGRDIGTVVFPDADVKFFMEAGIESRARRRLAELATRGINADLGVLKKEIAERDRRDSTRTVSPLCKAPDAIDVDTSDMTIEEQVEFVVHKVREKMREEGKE
jgi:cytidylate kinase